MFGMLIALFGDLIQQFRLQHITAAVTLSPNVCGQCVNNRDLSLFEKLCSKDHYSLSRDTDVNDTNENEWY